MPGSTNVVDDARRLMEKRLADLDEERRRLERALAELGGKSARRSPGRPRGATATKSKRSSKKTPKRRRRRGSKRADQAVSMIEKAPGIGVADIAKAMKIKANYLYRILGDLEKEGRVKKQGRQYFPGQAAPKKQ